MNKDKRKVPFLNVGTSLLLVIFLALCLSVFATLSLSSAHSDLSFSKRMADHKTAYYEADRKAEEILADLDLLMEQTAKAAGKSKNWIKQMDLTNINQNAADKITGNIELNPRAASLTYQVPVNDRQVLEVVLDLNTDAAAASSGSGYYQIHAWQVKAISSWESDQPIQLLPIQN